MVFEQGEDHVVVVADGAGGIRGGGDASDAFIAAVTSALTSGGFDITDPTIWNKLLTDVDHELAKTMAGKTTAVIAVVGSGGIVGVSAGDSQAWLVGETGADEFTADQTKKRLGSGRASPVSFFRPGLQGTLIVATDGLFKYATTGKIAETVRGREPGEAAEALRGLVALPSGKYQDDVGIVVLAGRKRFRE